MIDFKTVTLKVTNFKIFHETFTCILFFTSYKRMFLSVIFFNEQKTLASNLEAKTNNYRISQYINKIEEVSHYI